MAKPVAAFRRVGNWPGIKALTRNLSYEMRMAQKEHLLRWALHAEGTAKTHLSTQDMANGNPWPPLAARTYRRKKRLGLSTDTLIETSTYFQSITSYVKGDTAYAGVRRGRTYQTGQSKGKMIENIAAIQEFGSIARRIPARPLWKPTFEATMKWSVKHNNPTTLFLQRVRKRYG